MKIWTLRFLAGATALFLTAAPVALDANSESVALASPASLALPCEGSMFGCKPATDWVCTIRSGVDCSEAETKDNKCNLDHDACEEHVEPVGGPN